jgi:hypothetical protein
MADDGADEYQISGAHPLMRFSLLQSGDRKPLVRFQIQSSITVKMAISMIAVAALFGGGFFFVRPRETPDCERQVKLEAAGH